MTVINTKPSIPTDDMTTKLVRGKKAPPIMGKVDGCVIHCTAGPATQTPGQIARYHVESKKWPSIAYHYLIGPDGTVYRTLPEVLVGWHAHQFSRHMIAVSMIYMGGNVPPPKAQLAAAAMMCADICLRYSVDSSQVFGHRELKGSGWIAKLVNGVWRHLLRKVCPGMRVDLNEFRKVVHVRKLDRMRAKGI